MKIVYYLLLIAVVSLTTACGPSNSDNAAPPLPESDAMAKQFGAKVVAPQLVISTGHGGGYGWKNEKCFLCHSLTELEEIHDYSPGLSASFSMLGGDDNGACLYCHGTNGLTGVTAETYQCLRCHTDSSIVASTEMFAGHNMHDMNGDDKMDNADCVVCHDFSDMNGEIDVAIDFRDGPSDYENITSFCLNCHDGNGAFGIMPFALSIETEMTNIYSTYKGVGKDISAQKQTADIHGAQNGSGQNFSEFRGTYAESTEVACLDCHQVHSSNNAFLITESGTSAELADDQAKATAVEVTDNNFTQLCAVCHTSADGAPTDNGLTEVPHPSTYSSSCIDCHFHGAGSGADKSGLF